MKVSDAIAEIEKAKQAMKELNRILGTGESTDEPMVINIRNMLCEYIDMIRQMEIKED